jgi:hypothetical protein
MLRYCANAPHGLLGVEKLGTARSIMNTIMWSINEGTIGYELQYWRGPLRRQHVWRKLFSWYRLLRRISPACRYEDLGCRDARPTPNTCRSGFDWYVSNLGVQSLFCILFQLSQNASGHRWITRRHWSSKM